MDAECRLLDREAEPFGDTRHGGARKLGFSLSLPPAK
jgi:hypothetical protein